jgi:hypothetical protein
VSTANCLINRAASLVADVGGLYSTMSLGGASSIYLTRWSTGMRTRPLRQCQNFRL